MMCPSSLPPKAGHPCLRWFSFKKDVDGRAEPGHDGTVALSRLGTRKHA